jgi:geranylgeranyl reductase family protein
MYDVVIVGGGPAGSTAAKFLAERKRTVLLIDKAKFPREKPCGGGLTAKVLTEFPYVKHNDLIESYTYGGYVYAKDMSNRVEIKKDTPVMATVLRKTFDAGLVKLAVDQGCTLLEGRKVVDITFSKDHVKTTVDTGECIESKVVIGADGIWSITRKKAGLDPIKNTFAVSLFNEYKMDEQLIDQYFSSKRYGHLHLKLEGLSGYGWVFSKKNHINIGVGEMKPYHATNHTQLTPIFQEYIQRLKEERIIPEELSAGNVKGGALPTRPVPKTYGDKVLLCGDAAGLINPITGEGIHYAMYSGRIAAKIIDAALHEKNTSNRFLSKYEHQWKHAFGKDIALFQQATKQWDKTDFKYFDLLKQDEQLKEVLLEIMMGNASAQEYKYKILKRILYVKVKKVT